MLELKNVKKVYKDGKIGLKDINLEFADYGFILINGKSGSGKTTLLNIIGNIIKPSDGNVLYNNENINDIKNYTFNYISYVFQDYNLLTSLNVLENICFINKNDNKELIEQFHIQDIMNKKINEISGGEARRVAVIRSIVNNSKIVLCDEPTTSLDLENEYKILELLKEKSASDLVIVVSHHIELFSSFADRIITLEDGIVIEDKIINKIDKVKKTCEKVKKRNSLMYLMLKRIKQNKFMFILNILLFLLIFFLYFLSISLKKIDFNKIEVNLMNDNNIYKLYSDKKIEQFNPVYILDDFNLPLKENNTNLFYKDVNNIKYIEYKDIYDKNLIGNKPINSNELVINEYLFECIKILGIKNINDEYVYPKNIDDLINLEVLINNETYKITGVIKEKLDRYNILKDISNSSNLEKLTNIFEDDIIRSNFIYVNKYFLINKEEVYYYFYSENINDILYMKQIDENIESPVISVLEQYYNVLNTIKIIFKYVLYIIILFIFILSIIMNTNVINNYAKENRILYYIGYSKLKIVSMYVIDILIKYILSSSIALLVFSLFNKIINIYLTNQSYLIFSLLNIDSSLLNSLIILNIINLVSVVINTYKNINKNIYCK